MANLMHVIPRAGQNSSAPVLPPFRWLYDDFERAATTPPDLSGGDVYWTAGDGWHIAEVASATGNGVAVCDNPDLSNATADSRHTDYTLSAAMRPRAGTSTTTTGIILRYLDDQNFVWVGRNYASGAWRFQINAVIAGTGSQLATEPPPSGNTGTGGARFDLIIAGNQITTYIQSNLTFGGPITIPTALAAATRVGMRAARGNGFGDFGVYSHMAKSAAAPDYTMPDDD